MKKDQILQVAIKKNLKQEQIGENCTSALSLVNQCLRAIDITELMEEEKKEKLIKMMQSFWNGQSKYIAGCKRIQIQNIAKFVFGIQKREDKLLDMDLRDFDFKDLYLYYCYVEQMIKENGYFSNLIKENYKKTIEEQREMKKQRRIEEQKKQEQQKKAEEEKIGKMSKEERWRYEIFEQKKDINYFEQLDKSNEEDKIIIAVLLKEYWRREGKWGNNKVSKKQVVKISKIKEILDEE